MNYHLINDFYVVKIHYVFDIIYMIVNCEMSSLVANSIYLNRVIRLVQLFGAIDYS